MLAAVLRVTDTVVSDWRPGLPVGASPLRALPLVPWAVVAEHMTGRGRKQCRERWFAAVCPGICGSPWSADEVVRLFALHRRHPGKWGDIASQLPGRTPVDCRNSYNAHAARLLAMPPPSHGGGLAVGGGTNHLGSASPALAVAGVKRRRDAAAALERE